MLMDLILRDAHSFQLLQHLLYLGIIEINARSSGTTRRRGLRRCMRRGIWVVNFDSSRRNDALRRRLGCRATPVAPAQ